jgi:hypothetical protein
MLLLGDQVPPGKVILGVKVLAVLVLMEQVVEVVQDQWVQLPFLLLMYGNEAAMGAPG